MDGSDILRTTERKPQTDSLSVNRTGECDGIGWDGKDDSDQCKGR